MTVLDAMESPKWEEEGSVGGLSSGGDNGLAGSALDGTGEELYLDLDASDDEVALNHKI